MHISRIRIENSRAIAGQELRFSPGLNVICGGNEAGKSTVVEAIHKALYWVSTVRKSAQDNLEAILPAANAAALPTVELDLNVGDCSVTIHKVVTDKKKHRRCVVTLRADGNADETLEGPAAEERLAELLSGVRGAESLNHSPQRDRPYAFLDDRLPSAAINNLTLGRDGAILPSRRLEAVRAALEQMRKGELVEKLKLPLIDCARAGSDAGPRRDSLRRRQEELDEARREMAGVEELRREVQRLERQIAIAVPGDDEAQRNLVERRALRGKQQEARTRLAQSNAASEQQRRELADLESQANVLVDLKARMQTLETEVAGGEELKRIAEAETRSAHERFRTLTEKRDQQSPTISVTREQLTFLSSHRDVARAAEQIERLQRDIARRQGEQQAAADAQRELDAHGAWMRGDEIGRWRKAHGELNANQRDAATRLQVRLDLLRPARIEWMADGRRQPEAAAESNRAETLGAVRSLTIVIADVGTIHVQCGASELVELLESIEEQARRLDAALAPHGFTARDLPDGFDRLEERRIRGEQLERQVAAARDRLAELDQSVGASEVLRERLLAAERAHVAAGTRFAVIAERYSQPIPADCDAEIDRLTEKLRVAESQATELERMIRAADEEVGQCRVKAAGVEAIQSKRRTDLLAARAEWQRATCDQRTDEQRAAAIGQSRNRVYDADRAAAEAAKAVADLGLPVTADQIESLERNRQAAAESVAALRRELEKARTIIQERCQYDPQGRIDELSTDVAALAADVAMDERRLGGLVLLHTLLSAEQRRMARRIAEPLNRRLAPWLAQIRGLPTSIVLDQEQGRITHIVTERGGQRETLAFDEHSEGFKGQFALLLRLTLSKTLAEQNGGGQFVILDDPLTETSPDRRPEMFRILHQAARDMQILFVTCHHDSLALLPGEVNLLKL